MPVNLQRDLTGPGQMQSIRDLLQSLFVCELLAPSRPLWLYFAWVTDIDILDNSARQFATLCPDWPAAGIRLSKVLDEILRRGGEVNVLIRQARHNEVFADRLRSLRSVHGEAIRWCIRPEFHLKGMAGERYVIDGSMNLTSNGITVNDEHVILRCDPPSVTQRRMTLSDTWSEALT